MNVVAFVESLKNYAILLIFFLFVILLAILGGLYAYSLAPTEKKIKKLQQKFSANEYTIPIHIAERYLIWLGMRTFFFALDYLLTLLGIVASLMTVFYAATDTDPSKTSTLVFLSLLSLTFTIANIFIKAGSKANMSQHACRALDASIKDIIYKVDISENEKNAILAQKVNELEQYIESFEH